MSEALWQLGGWTMLHFLWAGTIVAGVGALVRLALRRASPAVRYASSLLSLAALAVTPVAIAAWVAVSGVGSHALQPRALPGGSATVEHEPTTTPGRSPGLQESATHVVDLAYEEPPALQGPVAEAPSAAAESAESLRSDARSVRNASPSPSLQGRGMSVSAFVGLLPWVWLIGAPVTFYLLAAGLIGSERLRRTGAPIVSGPIFEACQRLRQAMRITRRVSVAMCEGVAQPVLVGIVRPLILLPAAALSGWTPEELEMVLVHELAHVRRWDNLVNLLQRIVESLLFFHPVVWLASRQVRRDREECCDAVVVARTAQPQRYAELLVSIATTLRRAQTGPLIAASAMADHPLAGRIRRILKLEDEPMRVSRRTLTGLLSVPMLIIAATVYISAAEGGKQPGAPALDARPSDRIHKIYAVSDVDSVPFRDWLQLVSSDRRFEIKWDADKSAIVIAATQDDHERIAAFLRSARETAAPAEGRAVEAEEHVGRVSADHASIARHEVAPPPAADANAFQNSGNPFATSNWSRLSPSTQERLRALDRERTALQRKLIEVESLRNSLISERPTINLDALPLIEGDADAPQFSVAENKFLILQQRLNAVSRETSPDATQLRELLSQFNDARKELADAREKSTEYWKERFEMDATYVLEKVIATTASLRKQIADRERMISELDQRRTLLVNPSASKGRPKDAELKSPPAAGDVESPLQVGDEVKIQVTGASPEEPIGGLYVIEPQGTVALGATYGRVKIAGLSLLEAEKAVTEQLGTILKNVQVQITVPPSGLQLSSAAGVSPSAIPVVVTVVQKPTSQGNRTTAYLKVHMVWNSDNTPAQIERASMNQPALVTSNAVLSQAIAKVAGKPDGKLVALLAKRLQASFPGDGEILELALTADGTTPEADRTLLQAIIDAYQQYTEEQAKASGAPTSDDDGNPSPGPSLQGRKNAQTTYKYDGKTFDEWRDQWRLELKTENRIEAINALAAFARTGRGRDAAEAILEVAGEYNFDAVDGGPEVKVKTAIIEALAGDYARVAQADWLPALAERMEADPKRWRMLSYWVLVGAERPTAELTPEARTLLMKWAADEKFGPNYDWLHPLLRTTPDPSDELKQLVRKSLAGADVANALNILRMTAFNRLEELPEQFDLLFRGDEQGRRQARTILAQTAGLETRAEVTKRLIQILDDPQRSADHADAIRTLAIAWAGLIPPEGTSAEQRNKAHERLLEVLRSGDASLLPVAAATLREMGDEIFEADPAEAPRFLGGLSDGRRQALEAAASEIEEERQKIFQDRKGAGMGGMTPGGEGAMGVSGGGMF